VLYMIIERFKNRDPVPVYRRFRDQGRMAPEGLTYVSSRLLEQWMTRWSDVTDFEVIPVVTSAQAVERIMPRL